MLYQLPSGRVIQISLEQYLELTDDELHESLQYLTSINYGDYIRDPFHGSATKKVAKNKKAEEDPEDVDTRIDFTDEDEDKSHGSNIIEDVPLDELPDVPDSGPEKD